jgi:hypothetical protein
VCIIRRGRLQIKAIGRAAAIIAESVCALDEPAFLKGGKVRIHGTQRLPGECA